MGEPAYDASRPRPYPSAPFSAPPAGPSPAAARAPAVPFTSGPRPPSGLFPAGPRTPTRPTYREPHPVTASGVASGCAIAAVWLLVFGWLGGSVATYLWGTVIAGGLAWAVALVLIRYGDRGAGVGVALATSVGWSIATVVLAARWESSGDWPLW